MGLELSSQKQPNMYVEESLKNKGFNFVRVFVVDVYEGLLIFFFFFVNWPAVCTYAVFCCYFHVKSYIQTK